jgi:hypothetical protein
LSSCKKNAEFSQSIYVMTLPKSTDFYYQTQEYLDRDDAQKFLSAFQSKLASPEEPGFFFPAAFKTAELAGFSAKILPLIHREFFGGKKTLARRQREDFIEIFYQFLVLKALDFFQADAISFTCKDALDIGAAAQGLFFAFAQLFQGSLDSREEVDFFRWLLYAPAFFTRERPIDPEQLHRILSALETFDAQIGVRADKITKAFEELYSPGCLKKLHVKM